MKKVIYAVYSAMPGEGGVPLFEKEADFASLSEAMDYCYFSDLDWYKIEEEVNERKEVLVECLLW